MRQTAAQRRELSEVNRITRDLTGSYSNCIGPVKNENGISKIRKPQNWTLGRTLQLSSQSISTETTTGTVDGCFGEQLYLELEQPKREEIKKASTNLQTTNPKL